MLILNGSPVSSADTWVALTSLEYQALPRSEKMNGTVYLITDDEKSNQDQLSELIKAIGDTSKLQGHADGTLIGNIRNIFDNLGCFSFRFNDKNELEMVHDDTVTPVEIPDPPAPDATDAEKIQYMTNLVGSVMNLNKLGYPTLVDVILDIYDRMGSLGFRYTDEPSHAVFYDTHD